MVGRPRRPGGPVHDAGPLPLLLGHRVDAAIRDALRGRWLPFAVVLAPHRARLAAVVHQSRAADPVDPAWIPGDLLLLPQGLLPVLLRGSTGLRGRRADGPPPLRDGDPVPVHPPELAPLLPVSRLHSAHVPVDRRDRGALPRRQAATRPGRPHLLPER